MEAVFVFHFRTSISRIHHKRFQIILQYRNVSKIEKEWAKPSQDLNRGIKPTTQPLSCQIDLD